MRFPNVDISGMAGEDNVTRSMADDAAVLWFEVDGDTLTRIPYFVELDRWEDDPALKTLFVRPGVLLKGNTRYIVAFRGLTDTSGNNGLHAFRDQFSFCDGALPECDSGLFIY